MKILDKMSKMVVKNYFSEEAKRKNNQGVLKEVKKHEYFVTYFLGKRGDIGVIVGKFLGECKKSNTYQGDLVCKTDCIFIRFYKQCIERKNKGLDEDVAHKGKFWIPESMSVLIFVSRKHAQNMAIAISEGITVNVFHERNRL